eukprot:GHUV01007951.1.p1 GENE.GHUV01007951.1~~GHUV01007951.1.p1  ORF type:complete len:160 (+),score=24.27 GHUV01007951.1:2933-3412(+)
MLCTHINHSKLPQPANPLCLSTPQHLYSRCAFDARPLPTPRTYQFHSTCTLTVAVSTPSHPTEDLIIKEDASVRGGKYVGGVVTNWTLVTLHHDTQSCMDPNVIEAQVVVSSCGHDGPMGAHSVKRLSKLGMVPDVPGMAALDMNKVRGGGGPGGASAG